MDDLIRVLQASFAPCVLISGLGLLLLTLTNRIAKPIERIRLLCRELERAQEKETPALREQVRILYRRARLLQASIALLVASIFFVSVLMFMLFSAFVFHVPVEFLVKLLFMASLVCLMTALLFFMMDVRMALNSIKVEINRS